MIKVNSTLATVDYALAIELEHKRVSLDSRHRDRIVHDAYFELVSVVGSTR